MKKIPYRLPLVIGATGHRDLRDGNIKALEDEVAEAIKRLKSEYLHNDPETPIIVLSSLAEGGDRLIARVAMGLGAELIAPLPMEENEYRRDFLDPKLWVKPDAVIEFDRLKELAVAKPVMRFAEGNTRENVGEEARRALQYREVGLFIVRHCHVLIALWNGEDSKAVGGTAEVVRFKRDGIPLEVTQSARASLDAPEIGPVIHVVTPRAKPGDATPSVYTEPWGGEIVRRHRGGLIRNRSRAILNVFASLADVDLPVSRRDERDVEAWMAFQVKIGLTHRFNREAKELETSDRKNLLDTSLTYLFDDPERNPDLKIRGDSAKEFAGELIPHWCRIYQLADTLAQQRQKQFILDWRALFFLGFCAIVSFEVGTHLLFDHNVRYILVALYSLFFLGVFGWFFKARWAQNQERFLDYRALAEALRVAVFWKLVGIGWQAEKEQPSRPRSTVDLGSPDAVADAYPIRQPSELDWVKTCLRALELPDWGKSIAEVQQRMETEGHTWARAFWVHGQLAFFERRGPQHDSHAKVLESRSIALVVVSILLALCLSLLGYDLVKNLLPVGDQPWSIGGWLNMITALLFGLLEGPHDWLDRSIILLTGLLPGLAAVWTGYAERLALNAQARQYDRMRVVFDRAYELLRSDEKLTVREIQTIYAELGKEAMEENAEWVAIYRQRPIRPP
jgi:hypothetical protein